MPSPLSFQQRQIWLAEQSVQIGGLYNEASAIRLRGPLQVDRLERALETLLERHDALRTVFPLRDGEPVQVVRDPYPVPVGDGVVDLSPLPPPARMDELLAQTRSRAEKPFDLAEGPLLRTCLFRLAEDDHVLLLGMHHIVCDGWSLRLLLRELADRYTAPAASAPTPGRYVDFARTQRAVAEEGAWDGALAYWRETLAGAPTAVELPPDHPRPPVRRQGGRRFGFSPNGRVREALSRLASQADGSRLAALTATLTALVYRYTGRTDLVLGTGTDPRPSRHLDTVGVFANLVPLRLRPSGGATVRALLDHTCDAVFDAIDHASVPFEKVVEVAQPVRDPSHPQLVQLVCTVWDRDYSRLAFGDVEATLVEVPRGRARFDLMVEHVFDGDMWTMWTEYDTTLYDPATVDRFVWHYAEMIRAAADDLDATLASLTLLAPADEAAARVADRLVLDRDGNVLPVGAVGELHEATNGQALPTGRAARRTASGTIETLGLLSRRVRLGHLDVQLEQLEAIAGEHPAVRAATIEAADNNPPVLHVVPHKGVAATETELRAYLESRIPRAFLPATITVASTPDAVVVPSDGGVRAPSLSAMEQVVADVWSKLLLVERIAPHDDFFAIGGRSIVAAHAAQYLSQELGIDVRVRDVFTHPTVRELAAALTKRRPGLVADPGRTAGGTRTGAPADRTPVATAQLQIWLNAQLTLGAADDFNSAFAHRIRGRLNVGALRRALRQTVAHHPNLRAWFEVVDDLPEQRFAPAVLIDLPLVTLDDRSPPERPAEALRLARAEAARRFDIAVPPLLRALLVRLDDDDHLLAYTLHHLITDGVSMGVFHRDLHAGYAAALEGHPPALPETGVPYTDYVVWERDWLTGDQAAAARAYWRRTLHAMTELRLPPSRGERRVSLAVATRHRVLPAHVTGRLMEAAQSWRATTFMAVVAAWSVVLHAWSGQRDLVFGTLVDNRPLPGLQETVGCFANFVPLRVTYDDDLTFPELVGKVRDAALGAYEHQHLPFSEIVQAVGARRSYARMPIFQTTVQWVHSDQQTLALPGCTTEPCAITSDVSRYELTLFVTEDARGLVLDLEYATDLWDAESIDIRLADLVGVICAAVR